VARTLTSAADNRLAGWLLPLLLPVALLVLWLAVPALDSEIRVNPPHFWIVGAAGLLSLAVGLLMSEAARVRKDARVFLVSLSFLCNAGFILLHALATPNVLVPSRNVGFIIAAPVGIVVGALFAALSTIELDGERAQGVVQRSVLLRSALLGFLLVFSLLALLQQPPFTFVPDPEQTDTPALFCLVGQTPLPAFQLPASLALLIATGLYMLTARRYFARYRREPTAVLLGLITAFVLLALTTLNLGLGRTWHLTWWQWHVLMLGAFGLMAYSVYLQYRKEGSRKVLFDSVYLEETIRKIRAEYGSALDTLVAAFQRRAEQGDEEGDAVARVVAEQFNLSDGQVRVLEQAAEALAHERDQIRRLGALVAVGQETSVILDEQELLRRSLDLTADAFGRDRLRLGIVQGGALVFADSETTSAAAQKAYARVVETGKPRGSESHLLLPLLVKGHVAGVLEATRVRGSFAERDRYLLMSLASQLSTALENARLYHQIDALFRQYMPASVATQLLADPSQAALGGAVREISVMFGDLRGFTSLSERLSPPELVALLNRYYGAASGVVLEQGGTIDKFMGDAMMALFNAPAQQPDHALRACRAALAMQRVVAPIAAEAGDMPRFGIGVSTGEALVGNIGSEAIRNFTAIGDTVNLASRLQTRAGQGQVLISGATYAQVKPWVVAEPLGQIQVKGKAELVEAYLLRDLK
jgi:class 3 adenylate cyclase